MSKYCGYCGYCGAALGGAAKFCAACGKSIAAQDKQTEQVKQKTAPLPVISDPAYRIESVLGSGGGGVAYKAWHSRLQKYVVLKRIKDDSGLMQEGRRRGEADILKNLKHANLPQLYDFLEDEGGVYTVIEFIPGRSLDETLKSGARCPQPNVVRWARQLSDALRYLHGQKPPVLHSDIKPGNIMLTPEGDVCLIDFNISLVLTGGAAPALGLSHGYASPEQYGLPLSAVGPGGTTTRRRAARADARSDIYSLGATLYHMLTGVRPAAATDAVKPLREFGLPLSESFVNIIERCMARDPDARFQTAEELYGAIANIHRLDRRYTAHRVKAVIAAAALLCLFTASAATAALGWRRLGAEKLEKYNTLVLAIARERKDASYEEALTLFPEKPDAYREQAVKLCVPGSYEACIEYVNGVMAKLSAYVTDEGDLRMLSDIYYAQANAYFEMEDYPNSLASYDAAADGNPDNPELYRDWAISLARCGYIERAEDMMRDVKDMDIGADSTDLLRGEIAYAKGEDLDAIALFESVIRLTDSDYIKNRAYIICDKAYRRVPELVRANAALLREALDDLPAVYAPIIKERLADALTRAGEYDEAVTLFEELLQGGNLSYQTRQNIGVLYQQLGDHGMAKTIFAELAADYPDDYRPYMRLGYLALEEQAALPNELREYREVSEYYNEAGARYSSRGPGSGDDLEMQKLEGMIVELRQNGWIN